MEIDEMKKTDNASKKEESSEKVVSWMKGGAKCSYDTVSNWVKEPEDKSETWIRLAGIGLVLVVLVFFIIDKPVVTIGVICIGLLILFAVMAQFRGSVSKKEEESSEKPESIPVSPEGTAKKAGGVAAFPRERVATHSGFPAPEVGRAFVGASIDEVKEPVSEAVKATQRVVGPEQTEVAQSPQEAPSGALLEDTSTVRLRPAVVSAERPVMDLTKTTQPGLWQEPGAPLGGRIRLSDGGSWVAGTQRR